MSNEHRYEIDELVFVAEILPLPRQGRVTKQFGHVGRVEELRTSKDGERGYVIRVGDFDGPFPCTWRGVAFERHCEPAVIGVHL